MERVKPRATCDQWRRKAIFAILAFKAIVNSGTVGRDAATIRHVSRIGLRIDERSTYCPGNWGI